MTDHIPANSRAFPFDVRYRERPGPAVDGQLDLLGLRSVSRSHRADTGLELRVGPDEDSPEVGQPREYVMLC